MNHSLPALPPARCQVERRLGFVEKGGAEGCSTLAAVTCASASPPRLPSWLKWFC